MHSKPFDTLKLTSKLFIITNDDTNESNTDNYNFLQLQQNVTLTNTNNDCCKKNKDAK